MQIYRKNIKLVVPLLLLLYSCSPTRRLKKDQFLLRKVAIKGELSNVNKAEMLNYVKQKPNKKFLGFPFYLGIHNMFDEEKLNRIASERDAAILAENQIRAKEGKKLKSAGKKLWRQRIIDIGEPPVILDTNLLYKSTKQLELFLSGKGYFNASVTDSVFYVNSKKNRPSRKPKKRWQKAEVYFKVKSGKPYKISEVMYELPDPRIEKYVFWDTASSYVKVGENYDIDKLQNERVRIAENLLDLGFYYFNKQYVYFRVDSSLGDKKLSVTIGINNVITPVDEEKDIYSEKRHTQYYINNVFIQLDPIDKRKKSIRNDTASVNGMNVLNRSESEFKPHVITGAVFFKKGQLYKKKDAEKTYKRLSTLQAFRMINVNFKESPDTEDSLDCYIGLIPVAKQSISAEAQGTNTSGNLGISGSFIYQNRNLFRGLEVFELKLRGGVEAQKLVNQDLEESDQSVIPFNTIEFGPELKLEVPRFLLLGDYKASKSSDPRTSFTSYLNYQLRPDYTRYASNIAYGYTWKETAEKRHTINPIEVTFVKVEKQPAFEAFLAETNDLLIRNSYTDHLVTATRYTFQYNNQNLKRNSSFSVFKGNVEFSGNFLRTIYKLAGAQEDTNGSYRILNVRYSQYMRYDIDFRHYFKWGKEQQLVARFFGGIGVAFDNLNVMPFEKSFFAGGSNGIRAWRARSLGPGSFHSAIGKNFDQIGDIQLEANLEYRFKIFKMLNGAWFVDAGNVWLRKPDEIRPNGHFDVKRFYKEVAVGTGIGLRADFSFFLVRLDMGLKVYDPTFGVKGRFVMPNYFNSTWKDNFEQFYGYRYSFANFNLGIGYPF